MYLDELRKTTQTSVRIVDIRAEIEPDTFRMKLINIATWANLSCAELRIILKLNVKIESKSGFKAAFIWLKTEKRHGLL
jgi:hypothetical protein